MFEAPEPPTDPCLSLKPIDALLDVVPEPLEESLAETPLASPTVARPLPTSQGSHDFLACGLLADELEDLAEMELALGSPKLMARSMEVSSARLASGRGWGYLFNFWRGRYISNSRVTGSGDASPPSRIFIIKNRAPRMRFVVVSNIRLHSILLRSLK